MILRKTKPEEAGRVNELFAIAFELPVATGPADEKNGRIHHYAALEDDDKTMMSTLSVTDFAVNFDGNHCKMGGIGGVATLPQYRRQGGIRGCFELALPDMYREGYEFSYLFPFSTAYYRKFGFETCVQKLSWTVDLSLWKGPIPNGTWRLAEKATPMPDAIRYLDRVWERQFNMTVIHCPGDYGWTEKFDPAETREYTYVCFDEENTPKAYTTFQTVMEPDGRNLRCSRFCFDGKVGFYLLMGLFGTMVADHRYVKFQTPLEKTFQYYAREWSLGAVKWEVVQNCGMVRVVNVQRVLEKARYAGSGEAVLSVSDPHIPENDGAFRVQFENGRATCVERTREKPDVCLSVQAFSALICGVLDWADAVQSMESLEVFPHNCMDQIFYRKKMMITDYF